MNERDRQFELLIDRTLAGYAAEPRAGLENRTLARLAAAKEARSRALGWRWLLSGAVAATLLVAGFVGVDSYRRHRQQTIIATQQSPRANQVAYNSVPNSPRIDVKPPSSSTPARVARHYATVVTPEIASASMAPRPAQFPTPTPLNEQERLLARLAANTDPKVLGTLVASRQSEQIEPVTITPVEIAPLESFSGSASPQTESQSSLQTGPRQSNLR